ncbi:MAG: urea carboxylase [Chlamydiales bacterium]|jgi:urea carboxylase
MIFEISDFYRTNEMTLSIQRNSNMFKRILVANRGEIACRIIKTCRKLNIESIALYSDADRSAPHVRMADQAVHLGNSNPLESYLNSQKIIDIAKEYKADAIHPGYGFLSEDFQFAEECGKNNITFIGPSSPSIQQFSIKERARRFAGNLDIPIVPGSSNIVSLQDALQSAEEIGYPVLLKCSGGGGGIGMTLCQSSDDLSSGFESTKKAGKTFFNNEDVFLEKYISEPHHIEVQIFGDGKGNIAILGERECSIQRRYQKVIEETPSPFCSEDLRQQMYAAARKLGEGVAYESAGTVEFLVDEEENTFYFLEVNTRLQVEHTVTEQVSGIDLVEWMIRQAAKEELHVKDYVYKVKGHSIQARVYAEDPLKNFQPSPGVLTEVQHPSFPWLRIDSGVETGFQVPSNYDPMLAKIIVHGEDRTEAVKRLQVALKESRFDGCQTNLSFLHQIVSSKAFLSGRTTTNFLKDLVYEAHHIEVIDGGINSSVQDYPGRAGYWDVGIPRSGPMDLLSFRIANLLVGNAEGVAALEFTLEGPTLLFHQDTVVALSGAEMEVTIDGEPVEWWKAIRVRKGNVLTVGGISGDGYRSYMAVHGGLDLPEYLGSKSTFALGNMGGLKGNTVIEGDILPIHKESRQEVDLFQRALPKEFQPVYGREWKIDVLYGPHGAPDFFTQEDIDMFFSAAWKVHHNSNRMGIRLIGPKPKWARQDGGEAGLHPSNIHDCEYAVGAINFTGDMPIILTHDGPSLGGFVCPATIIQADMWKLGQVKPNDTITFVKVSYDAAIAKKKKQEGFLTNVKNRSWERKILQERINEGGVLYEHPGDEKKPKFVIRMAGDRYVLIEYGPMVLDLDLRFRIHALMEWLSSHDVDGILEMSPGVRSVQIRYDNKVISLYRLLDVLLEAEEGLPDIKEMVVKSRVVKLPIALDDQWCRAAVDTYMKSVRDTAPYLPDNIEFIKRINGLGTSDEVLKTICEAEYLVLGLGDVYLGAPCAVPLDPRHRLITSKYNPARTLTPEGAVGIGGAYMCIYGMESPGGYQLVGRTLPIWDKFVKNSNFVDNKPWLLRFFDRVSFYPVSDEELIELRNDFKNGKINLKIEEGDFHLKDYHDFLDANAKDIEQFQTKQKIAYQTEVKLWKEQGMIGGGDEVLNLIGDGIGPKDEVIIPDNCFAIKAKYCGNISDILVKVGDRVEPQQTIAVVEAMKMFMDIKAQSGGVVKEVIGEKGSVINQGEIILIADKG